MIVRPLELASRLRPAPRSFDALHYVNVGLLGLFFALFGSHFVLSPGLQVDVPEVPGALAGALPARFHLSIRDSGQIFTDNGLIGQSGLPAWLRAKAASAGGERPALLIQASAGVPFETVERVTSMAHAAGFAHILYAEEPPAPSPTEGR